MPPIGVYGRYVYYGLILSWSGYKVLMAAIFYYFSKLSDNGTLSIKNAIGGLGEVYLPVIALRGNIGKVQIKVQGALRELDAITDDESDLSTGTVITVLDVVNNSTLIVTKSNK